MRNNQEVREKFEELKFDRLRKRKEEFLSTACRNCAFNNRVHIKGKGKVRLCHNKDVLAKLNREVFVCEEDEVATRCGKYKGRNTKEQVELEFKDILRSPARCGSTYPKLALLIWFLQERPRGNRGTRMKLSCQSTLRSMIHLITFRWW
jgi:hypothetical protein